MPWTAAGAAALAEMGVHWVRVADAGEPLPQADLAQAADAAGSAAVSAPGPRADVEPIRTAVAPRAGVEHRPVPGGAGAAGGLDWEPLREAVRQCRACGLCETRKQTVFGVGHEHAHWMVVGEAPGEQEDLKGEPFVGAAGRLLDNMLQALGLLRAWPAPGEADEANGARQVYIANTLKCRPPGNRNPAPEELARCEPFLIRQIELVHPRLILAMGRFAIQSLLRSTEPVGRLRGQVHRYQGVPLICTYHPAYLLRNPADKIKAWEDLCLAHAVMQGAQSATPHPQTD